MKIGKEQSSSCCDWQLFSGVFHLTASARYLLTVSDKSEFFGIGTQRMRTPVLKHPEILSPYGQRRMIVCGEAERRFCSLPVSKDGRRGLQGEIICRDHRDTANPR